MCPGARKIAYSRAFFSAIASAKRSSARERVALSTCKFAIAAAARSRRTGDAALLTSRRTPRGTGVRLSSPPTSSREVPQGMQVIRITYDLDADERINLASFASVKA